jgi:D-alanyl-D-alanine carboxypeptidase
VAIQDSNYLPPGQEYRYSNFGYCLLGMVIEHVTGKPLAGVLQDDLLTPLSLKNSKLDNAKGFITSRPHASGNLPNVPELLAPGVNLGPDKFIDTTSWNTSWTWAAGSMCGTAEDLKTWIEADAGGKLLDPATVTLQQKTDVVPTAPGNPTKYGLGIIASPNTDGTTIYWHNGAVPGYSTFAGNDPDAGFTVVVLYNMNPTVTGDPLSATRTALELSKVMGFTAVK